MDYTEAKKEKKKKDDDSPKGCLRLIDLDSVAVGDLATYRSTAHRMDYTEVFAPPEFLGSKGTAAFHNFACGEPEELPTPSVAMGGLLPPEESRRCSLAYTFDI